MRESHKPYGPRTSVI